MSDDFETVRENLRSPYTTVQPGYAALDRIEARLREAELQRDVAWIESTLHEQLDECATKVYELERVIEKLGGGGMVSTPPEDPKGDR